MKVQGKKIRINIQFYLTYFKKSLMVFCVCALNKSISQIGPNWQPVDIASTALQPLKINRDSLLLFYIQEANKFYSYGFRYNEITEKDSILNPLIHLSDSIGVNVLGSFNIQIPSGLDSTSIQCFLRLHKHQNVTAKEIERLKRNISFLKMSKEKISIKIGMLSALLPREAPLNEMYNIYSEVTEEANQIEDAIEKGQAYLNIGDFFKSAQFQNISFKAYFSAQMKFYLSGQDSIVSFYWQGVTCEKVAHLFDEVTKDNNAIIKQNSYFLTASEYYKKSGKRVLADAAFAKYLKGYSELILNSTKSNSFLQPKEKLEPTVLHYLKIGYDSLVNVFESRSEKNQLLISIGNVLLAEGKYDQAKSYYIYALILSATKREAETMFYCYCKLSNIYAISNRSQSAFEYSEAAINFAKRIKDSTMLCKAMLCKADVCFNFKNYDLSLRIVDSVLSYLKIDTAVNTPFVLSVAYPAYELKLKILRRISSNDIFLIQTKFSAINNQQAFAINRIFAMEGESIAEALSKIKEYETDMEKYKRSEVEKLNNQITKVTWALGIALVIVAILFYRIFSQGNIIRRDLTRKVAFKNITGHDIRALINSIPKKIEIDVLLSNDLRGTIEFAYLLSKYVEDIITSAEQLSTVKKEVEFAKRYATLYKFFKLDDKSNIIISNDVDDKFIFEKLPVPAHLLNYFIKNSIEHGFDDNLKKTLQVKITTEQIKNDIRIIIDDNGCGINFSRKRKKNRTVNKKEMGLAKETIFAFNAANKNFKIEFSNKDIIDKAEKGLGRGTRIILHFKKRKWKLRL